MRRAILLVAFGASSAQGQNALKGFDALVRQHYPGIPVRWAYTSLLLRERLALVEAEHAKASQRVDRLGQKVATLERSEQVGRDAARAAPRTRCRRPGPQSR